MNKLFFDDVRDKPGDDWFLARDVPEAKRLMELMPFNVMSLDHDIGFQMMCDTCHAEVVASLREEEGKGVPMEKLSEALIEKSHLGCPHMEHGTDLAKWMVENLQLWPSLIIIHSANPYGAQRMADILKEKTQVMIAPFHSPQFKHVVNEVKRNA